MVRLNVVATGSNGNCYLLETENETVILECGIPIAKIKQAINFDVGRIVCCAVTHKHADHAKSVADLDRMGVEVLTPYAYEEHPVKKLWRIGDWYITSFQLTDIYGDWTHTNGDGTPCPIYGYIVYHPDMGNLLYVTDTELIKYRFKHIDHALIGINYQQKYVEDSPKRSHVFKGHLELQTACDFISVCQSNRPLQNVIACHLSDFSIEPEECIAELRKCSNTADIQVAQRYTSYELRKPNECPF